VTAKVSFLPNVARCELCPVGVACMQVDGVWLCESCVEVLVPVPEPLRTVSLAGETDAREGPSLLKTLETLLRSTP
jgi:hypothetical protein